MKPMRILRAGLVVAALTAAHTGQAISQVRGEPLSIDEAVSLAREANPMLRAARLRADAASERVSQAGALPDPQFTFGLLNRPVGDFRRTDCPVGYGGVGPSPALPLLPDTHGIASSRRLGTVTHGARNVARRTSSTAF